MHACTYTRVSGPVRWLVKCWLLRNSEYRVKRTCKDCTMDSACTGMSTSAHDMVANSFVVRSISAGGIFNYVQTREVNKILTHREKASQDQEGDRAWWTPHLHEHHGHGTTGLLSHWRHHTDVRPHMHTQTHTNKHTSLSSASNSSGQICIKFSMSGIGFL